MKKFIDSNYSRFSAWDDLYRCNLCLFERLFLKVDKDMYCLFDLRFLIDRICSGFVFFISRKEYNIVKGSYGILIEKYFVKLLRNIFKDTTIDSKIDGHDAKLESDKNVLIFEFTTEYYQFSSLYQSDNKKIVNDLMKNLFKEKGGARKKELENSNN